MLGIGERLGRAAVGRDFIVSGLSTPAKTCKGDMFAIRGPGVSEHDKRSEGQLLAFAAVGAAFPKRAFGEQNIGYPSAIGRRIDHLRR